MDLMNARLRVKTWRQDSGEAMIRKQIYLEEETEEHLKRIAKRRGTSEASVIRDVLKSYLSNQESLEHPNPLYELIGLCEKGRVDSSERHDEYSISDGD